MADSPLGSDATNTYRPLSCMSTRLPSQNGVSANFSRPMTAAEQEEHCNLLLEESSEEETIDDCLITQIKDILDDSPVLTYARFGRCEIGEDDDRQTKGATPDIFDSNIWDTDLESDAEEEEEEEEEEDSTTQLYMKICARLNVVPVSYFVRHIDSTSISLKYHCISTWETSAIARSLKKMLNIEKLNLEGNCMKNRGCKFLCQVLEDNQSIRELSIADNTLSDSCVTPLVHMLSHNNTLKKLSLAENLFTDSSAYALADCLEDCKLTVLDLSRNKFSVKGGVMFGPALGTNVYLDVLNLSWNQIRDQGALAIAKGLKENVHLSVCDLSWNGFSESGGIAMADALIINTTLKEIDVSSNRLTYLVAVKFAKALGTNEVLEVLKMANNPITTSGCLALVEAVNKNGTSVLNYLDLSENPVDYEFLRVVGELTTTKTDFQVFHGAILRAGNTSQDIGKPAIDIVRLSQQPVMLIKGCLKVNNAAKLMESLYQRGIKTKFCLVEKLIQYLKDLDSTITYKAALDALAKVPRWEEDKILISDLLKL